MSGMKKAKCYKKSGVKVWFGRLGNADKYWLESFRDYTGYQGGIFQSACHEMFQAGRKILLTLGICF